MSDPGRLSISPIRMRSRIGSCTADQFVQRAPIEEESLAMGHPRLRELRSTSPLDDDHFPELDSRSRSREKSLPSFAYPRRKHPQRSMSLPCSELAVLGIGEAIGALAVKSSSMPFKAELTPPSRRRRSVSIEPNSLEAIAEEGSSNRCSRRFSTSEVFNL